jgi:hypothetical protein
MLTRYKGQLKLKDWAFAIARRSSMRKARIALARRLAIVMHACCATEPSSNRRRFGDHGDKETVSSSRKGATPEGGSRRRRGFCSTRPVTGRLRFQPCRPAPELTPSSANRARRERRHPNASIPGKSLPPLTH